MPTDIFTTDSGNSYNGEYSVSFGDIANNGTNWYFSSVANTWSRWHLIPLTRHAIATPAPNFKFIEVPGAEDPIDMSSYLTGRLEYGWRQGSLSFLVDPGYKHWAEVRDDMVTILHGKRRKMMLQDDPAYYYEGYFTVGEWQTGETNSTISISYQLKPYKIRINPEGTRQVVWDTLNFDTDIDYSVLMGTTTLAATATRTGYKIEGTDYPAVVTVICTSGTAVVQLNSGQTWTLSSGQATELTGMLRGTNTLYVQGSGAIKVEWRGGTL